MISGWFSHGRSHLIKRPISKVKPFCSRGVSWGPPPSIVVHMVAGQAMDCRSTGKHGKWEPQWQWKTGKGRQRPINIYVIV